MEDKALIVPTSSGYNFLRECAKLAPTYYSYGNHEIGCYHKGKPWLKPTPVALPDAVREYIAQTGAILLDDESVSLGVLRLCGLRSGLNGHVNKPNEEALKRFDQEKGFRILLCHHPEYYEPYIRELPIDDGFGTRPRRTVENFRSRCFCAGAGDLSQVYVGRFGEPMRH